eukprot:UN11903
MAQFHLRIMNMIRTMDKHPDTNLPLAFRSCGLPATIPSLLFYFIMVKLKGKIKIKMIKTNRMALYDAILIFFLFHSLYFFPLVFIYCANFIFILSVKTFQN